MLVITQLAILFASMGVLVYFANKLIDSASRIARATGISEVIIGMTLVAYGTSLPEFAVSVMSSYKAHPVLSVANVVGSNICNMALIIGIIALIHPIRHRDETLWKKDGMFMLGGVTLLIIMSILGGIGRMVGAAMFAAVVLFNFYLIMGERSKKTATDGTVNVMREVGLTAVSISGVLMGANFTVNSAVNISTMLGTPEWLIGATIVAIGTSLPELTLGIMAAMKGRIMMSLGDIVGANYINILWGLGFASMVRPITIDFAAIWTDLVFLFVISLVFIRELKKMETTRRDGIMLLGLYAAFLIHLLIY
ncbi:MAG: calcium/sodium antiporter [archaeon]